MEHALEPCDPHIRRGTRHHVVELAHSADLHPIQRGPIEVRDRSIPTYEPDVVEVGGPDRGERPLRQLAELRPRRPIEVQRGPVVPDRERFAGRQGRDVLKTQARRRRRPPAQLPAMTGADRRSDTALARDASSAAAVRRGTPSTVEDATTAILDRTTRDATLGAGDRAAPAHAGDSSASADFGRITASTLEGAATTIRGSAARKAEFIAGVRPAGAATRLEQAARLARRTRATFEDAATSIIGRAALTPELHARPRDAPCIRRRCGRRCGRAPGDQERPREHRHRSEVGSAHGSRRFCHALAALCRPRGRSRRNALGMPVRQDGPTSRLRGRHRLRSGRDVHARRVRAEAGRTRAVTGCRRVRLPVWGPLLWRGCRVRRGSLRSHLPVRALPFGRRRSVLRPRRGVLRPGLRRRCVRADRPARTVASVIRTSARVSGPRFRPSRANAPGATT